MITRKDLVESLRVLHENDLITKIVTRAKRIDISFKSGGFRDCLLVIPNPTPTNDRNTKTKTLCNHVYDSLTRKCISCGATHTTHST